MRRHHIAAAFGKALHAPQERIEGWIVAPILDTAQGVPDACPVASKGVCHLARRTLEDDMGQIHGYVARIAYGSGRPGRCGNLAFLVVAEGGRNRNRHAAWAGYTPGGLRGLRPLVRRRHGMHSHHRFTPEVPRRAD